MRTNVTSPMPMSMHPPPPPPQKKKKEKKKKNEMQHWFWDIILLWLTSDISSGKKKACCNVKMAAILKMPKYYMQLQFDIIYEKIVPNYARKSIFRGDNAHLVIFMWKISIWLVELLWTYEHF